MGRREAYNLSADLYSFGILLWYIMALEPPFALFTPEMIIQKVFKEGDRPVTLIEWSDKLTSLMESCWDETPGTRPSFEIVRVELHREIGLVSPEIAEKLEQSSTIFC